MFTNCNGIACIGLLCRNAQKAALVIRQLPTQKNGE
jgi:hypothetical protein